MKEKFVPQFLDPKSGEIKSVPPERLAEIEKEEKELEKQEEARIIRLKRDATFVDLLEAEEKAKTKIDEMGAEDENVEIDVFDPSYLIAELWDNFDESIAEEVLDMRDKLGFLRSKRPEEYTEEEKKLVNIKVVEYFQEKGYSIEDIETFLPIKFKKEKKKK